MLLQQCVKKYFQDLYARTMREAYAYAHLQIKQALIKGGNCLDCGAYIGARYQRLRDLMSLDSNRYYGIEWNKDAVIEAQKKGLNVIQGDLNKRLPFEDNSFQCVFALSTLEHLLNGCHWIKESKRILKKGGVLVILTPNISTWFTIALMILGKMPSSGPHPDSDWLINNGMSSKIKPSVDPEIEGDTPIHRHLVVFSYRTLKKYLRYCGFNNIHGRALGLYPFPGFMQPLFEKVDPWHCHQMIFTAVK